MRSESIADSNESWDFTANPPGGTTARSPKIESGVGLVHDNMPNRLLRCGLILVSKGLLHFSPPQPADTRFQDSKTHESIWSVGATLIFAFATIPGPVSVPAQDVRITKLLAIDRKAGDWFGCGVAIDGDTAVVGASGDDTACINDPDCNSGAAYVFLRMANGDWVLKAKLTSLDTRAGDRFGASVAIDGDTIVIGRPAWGAGDPRRAGAYVFDRIDQRWMQTRRLAVDDGSLDDAFGVSVAIDGDTVVVGSLGASGAGSTDAAYVFVRNEIDWEFQEKLTPEAGSSWDGFGYSVAVDGNRAFIGAPNQRSDGSLYVYDRVGEKWFQSQQLKPTNQDVYNGFGSSVDISRDTLVIGEFRYAFLDDTMDSSDTGASYIFTHDGAQWVEHTRLAQAGPMPHYYFGISVSIEDDTVLIGSPGFQLPFGLSPEPSSGAGHLFSRKNKEWSSGVGIIPADSEVGDYFGVCTDLSGGTAIIGASGEDGACPSDPDCDSGAAYIYENIGVLLTPTPSPTPTPPPPNAVPAQIWRRYR